MLISYLCNFLFFCKVWNSFYENEINNESTTDWRLIIMRYHQRRKICFEVNGIMISIGGALDNKKNFFVIRGYLFNNEKSIRYLLFK